MGLIARAGRAEMNAKQLEGWLSRVLVPVEPSPRFVRRLRARLVMYRGRHFPPLWFGVAALASILLIAVGLLTSLIRILVIISGGLASRRRARQGEVR